MSNENKDVIKIEEATKTTLSNKLKTKQLGFTAENSMLGFNSSSGMKWYPSMGNEAEFSKLTVDNLSGTGYRNIGVDHNGTLQVYSAVANTDTVGVVDTGTESLSGDSVTQKEVNEENKTAIKELQTHNPNLNEVLTSGNDAEGEGIINVGEITHHTNSGPNSQRWRLAEDGSIVIEKGSTGLDQASDRIMTIRFGSSIAVKNGLGEALGELEWNNDGSISIKDLDPTLITANDDILTKGYGDANYLQTVISTFLGLTDTPASYHNNAGKILAVNSTENALEFIDSPTEGVPSFVHFVKSDAELKTALEDGLKEDKLIFVAYGGISENINAKGNCYIFGKEFIEIGEALTVGDGSTYANLVFMNTGLRFIADDGGVSDAYFNVECNIKARNVEHAYTSYEIRSSNDFYLTCEREEDGLHGNVILTYWDNTNRSSGGISSNTLLYQSNGEYVGAIPSWNPSNVGYLMASDTDGEHPLPHTGKGSGYIISILLASRVVTVGDDDVEITVKLMAWNVTKNGGFGNSLGKNEPLTEWKEVTNVSGWMTADTSPKYYVNLLSVLTTPIQLKTADSTWEDDDEIVFFAQIQQTEGKFTNNPTDIRSSIGISYNI